MFPGIRSQYWQLPGVIAIVLIFSTSCGHSGSGSVGQTLTSAQAQAVQQELEIALSDALSSEFSLPPMERHSVSHAIANLAVAQTSGCTINPDGQTCDIPISYSGACPAGGTIAVTGDFKFTLDNSGDGSDNSTLTITPTNCVVGNLTINGDPNVTMAEQLNFQANQLAFPVTLTESGGISYGPNPSGSCTLNASMIINSPTSCTITGNICGQKITGSCQ
ncbi:MAG TPA: hypothetical protein VMH04_13830 [Candidatus Solibacter sp.]|nr:hypothetical protein [Candidatus Solibacter sp.]